MPHNLTNMVKSSQRRKWLLQQQKLQEAQKQKREQAELNKRLNPKKK